MVKGHKLKLRANLGAVRVWAMDNGYCFVKHPFTDKDGFCCSEEHAKRLISSRTGVAPSKISVRY